MEPLSMNTLILGLVAFHGIHLLPTARGIRLQVRDRIGTNGYLLLFSLLSFIGLALIAYGYGDARTLGRANPQLWVPPLWTKHIAFTLMLPAMILIVAAYIPSRIRTAAKHPMLLSIKLWALAHLLVRGDLASLLLFGSFLAYAVFDRISVKQRAALGPLGNAPGTLYGDIAAVAIGLAAYVIMLFWGHKALIGVKLVGN
jgi:uncharacterized membrane protein